MDICKIIKPVGEVAKFGTSVVGGAAAGFVVDGMVKALLPAPVKPVGKILTIVGTSMLSGALADVAVDKWCDSIDSITGFFSKDETDESDESDFECDKEEEGGEDGDIRPTKLEVHAAKAARCID